MTFSSHAAETAVLWKSSLEETHKVVSVVVKLGSKPILKKVLYNYFLQFCSLLIAEEQSKTAGESENITT